MPKTSSVKKKNISARHQAVYDHFNKLHEIDRKRYDDCIEECAKKFFYSKVTVEGILYNLRKVS